jgi:hypothetical protein
MSSVNIYIDTGMSPIRYEPYNVMKLWAQARDHPAEDPAQQGYPARSQVAPSPTPTNGTPAAGVLPY